MLPWRRTRRKLPDIEEDRLSPLDFIRHAEAEVTRRVVATREAADRSTAEAASEAQSLIEQAHLAGRQEGQAKYAEIVNSAETEAEATIIQVQQRVEQMLEDGQRRIDAAVQLVLDVMLEEKK